MQPNQIKKELKMIVYSELDELEKKENLIECITECVYDCPCDGVDGDCPEGEGCYLPPSI